MRYGICTSWAKAKRIEETGVLAVNDRNYVTAFASPDGVEERIQKTDRKGLRNLMRALGGEQLEAIVLFETGFPGEQTAPRHWLVRYKFPAGLPVDRVYRVINI